MGKDEEKLLNELVVESKEHLANIEPDLLAMEKGESASQEAINRIFRAIHSIKGGFGFFGKERIKELSHVMENVLMKVRDGEMEMTTPMVDALLSGTDKLSVMLDDINQSDNMDIDHEIGLLKNILDGVEEGAASEKTADKPAQEPGGVSDLSAYGLTQSELKKIASHGKHLFKLDLPLQKGILENGLSFKELWNKVKPLVEVLKSEPPVKSLEGDLSGTNRVTQVFSSILEPDILIPTISVASDCLFSLSSKELKEIISNTAPKKGQKAQKAKGGKPQEKAGTGLDPKGKKSTTANSAGKHAESQETIRVKVDLLNKIVNLAGELVLGRNQLMQQLKETDLPGLKAITQNIDIVTSDLQENIMNTRMQPIGNIFGKFMRVVRDVAKQLNKEIDISFSGENVELDKSILESLTDPLTHLVRNSADHGIEAPSLREAAGKSRMGRIKLSAFHEGGQVNVEIKDDGGGIDVDIVKGKALENGVISESEAEKMSDKEVYLLLFEPGFSTAKQVTDVSGRGVGMDVVRTNIEELGGTVEVDSECGKGTKVTLKLPLTLAIIPSLVVTASGRKFALPQVSMEQLVRFRAEESSSRIERIQGHDVFRLRDDLIPLVRLDKILGMEATFVHPESQERLPDRRENMADRRGKEVPPKEILEKRKNKKDRRCSPNSATNIVVLRVGSNRFGLIVESLLDNEEIVVKPLSRYVKKCKCYSGATIMGDGKIALILDPMGIAEEAQLRFSDLEREKARNAEGKSRMNLEAQPMLLFKCSEKEIMAMNLSMIARVEKVACTAIEQVGKKEYLKYSDHSLRVIRPHNHMPIQEPSEADDHVYVIVPKLVKHPMGIVVGKVMDVVETSAEVDRENVRGTGIHGSMIINEMLVTLVDVYSLFEAADPETYTTAFNDAEFTGKRVLLAEDTAFFRTLQQSYLESLGFTVDTAKDGRVAWSMLNAGTYDLLVTDLEMPYMNGFELTRKVRESKNMSALPVIALTSLSAQSQMEKGMDAGVDAYELKLDKEKLRETIIELIQNKTLKEKA